MNDAPLFWNSDFIANHSGVNLQRIELKKKYPSQLYLINFETQQLTRKNVHIPGRLTFGGIWPISNFQISQDEVISVFDYFTPKKECHILASIKLPPSYFYPEIFYPQLSFFLNNRNYRYVKEINQTVLVRNWSFSQMSKGNKKKINQFMKAGGTVGIAEESNYKECIKVLQFNRKKLGLTLSMTTEEIISSLVKFPEKYRMFFAKINDIFCAAALVVSISDTSDYVLFWGDTDMFRSLSPVSSLFIKILGTCKKAYLDLGISSLDGKLNEGLYRYKKNLGAEDFVKYHFYLNI